MKIGLFFGSFNPIHSGHLIIANVVLETSDLDKIWFVVSPQNPTKRPGNLLHEFDRLDMVRAAVLDNYKMEVCDIEFSMPRPSYTIDTMTYLGEKHPDKDFALIIGEDNLNGLKNWKNADQLIRNFEFYVYPRPEYESTSRELVDLPNVVKVKAPLLHISATFIRSLAKAGLSIRYLVPDAVAEIIESRGLYNEKKDKPAD